MNELYKNIQTITIDERSGGVDSEKSFSSPTWDMVLQWISRLDGKKSTLLSLFMTDGTTYLIGGDELQRVVVHMITPEKSKCLCVRGVERGGQMVRIVVGGQESDFDPCYALDTRVLTQHIVSVLSGTLTETDPFVWEE